MESRVSLAACRPYSLGMLVYRLSTSRVTSSVFDGNFLGFDILCRKSVVSLTYDLRLSVVGLRKWSTNYKFGG